MRTLLHAPVSGSIGMAVFAALCACLCLSVLPLSAAGLDSLSAQDWQARGRFMGGIGNYRKAVEAFSRVIELDPYSAHAYHYRGAAYSGMGNYRLAIRDFNRAIQLNPDETLFRFNRGMAFGKAEQYELAVQDFKRVIEMDPLHTNARFYLGLIQRSIPGEVQRGSDNIKTAARMGNNDAREYLHAHLMGWY